MNLDTRKFETQEKEDLSLEVQSLLKEFDEWVLISIRETKTDGFPASQSKQSASSIFYISKPRLERLNPAANWSVVSWLGVGPFETPSSHANVLIDFAIAERLFMHSFLGLTVSHRLPGIKALRTFQLSLPYHSLSHNSGSYDTDASTGAGLLMIYVQWGLFVILFLCDDH